MLTEFCMVPRTITDMVITCLCQPECIVVPFNPHLLLGSVLYVQDHI